jgi:hypothetical protein
MRAPRRVRPLLLVLTLALLFACQSPSTSSLPPSATASHMASITQTTVASAPAVLSPTPTTPRSTRTPSPVPTTTPTATPSVTPTVSCVPRETARLDSDLAPGLLLFSGGSDETSDDSYWVALDTRQGVLSPFFPDEIDGLLGDVSISPDGRRLAMVRAQSSGGHERSDLIVMSADPATITVIPWNRAEWVSLAGWLSDNQRLIFSAPFDPFDHPRFERPDEFVIFDTVSGLQQPLTPTFPYAPDGFIVEYWDAIGSSVIYDPTLTRVVYLDDDQHLVLWNLREDREVWRYYYPFLIGSDLPVPVWSPDGQKLAQAVQSVEPGALPVPHAPLELRITDGAGAVTQHVMANYEFLFQFPRDMSWSPDGRYLVFYYTSPDEEPSIYYRPQLLLWDTATEAVIDYCLTATGPGVVWSPDSRQFSANVYDLSGAEEPGFLNVVVDVDQQRVFEIRDTPGSAQAWLRVDDK